MTVRASQLEAVCERVSPVSYNVIWQVEPRLSASISGFSIFDVGTGMFMSKGSFWWSTPMRNAPSDKHPAASLSEDLKS